MSSRRLDRVIAVVLLVIVAAIFVAAGVFGTIATQAARSQEAFDLASAQWTEAVSAAEDAAEAQVLAEEQAQAAASDASALLAVVNTAMLEDPNTAAQLQEALDEAIAVAELTVVAPGEITRASSPVPAPREAPATPTTTEERFAAAEELEAAVPAVQAEAEELTGAAERTEDATAALTAATDAVVASARTKGAGLTAPSLASTASVDAFTAAVTSLDDPAGGSPAQRVQAYQDAWAAVEQSQQDAETAARSGGGGSSDGIQPTYINGILIANKTYALPSWYGNGLTGDTVAAFESMRAEAATLGLSLYISSGFRSYASQSAIYNRFVANEGVAGADTHSARPGHSEHQTGLAIDLNTISESFGYTPEGQWVAENAHRFGFIVRYPQGKQSITGYVWEPWHLRYLGVDAATAVYNSGLSLEEYLGITSVYQ